MITAKEVCKIIEEKYQNEIDKIEKLIIQAASKKKESLDLDYELTDFVKNFLESNGYRVCDNGDSTEIHWVDTWQ